ncbi:hypothetical protein BZA77DRAFT_321020 [Pyronema omphalodes]|nr:hypothetical protein BZA77DRAFT_321020 [Pyronema omphalodes]
MTTPITIAKRAPNTAAAASPGRSVSANHVSANRPTDYESSSPKPRNSSIGVPGRSPNKWRPHNTSLGIDSPLKSKENVGTDPVAAWKTDLPTRMRKPPPKFAADNGTTNAPPPKNTTSAVPPLPDQRKFVFPPRPVPNTESQIPVLARSTIRLVADEDESPPQSLIGTIENAPSHNGAKSDPLLINPKLRALKQDKMSVTQNTEYLAPQVMLPAARRVPSNEPITAVVPETASSIVTPCSSSASSVVDKSLQNYLAGADQGTARRRGPVKRITHQRTDSMVSVASVSSMSSSIHGSNLPQWDQFDTLPREQDAYTSFPKYQSNSTRSSGIMRMGAKIIGEDSKNGLTGIRGFFSRVWTRKGSSDSQYRPSSLQRSSSVVDVPEQATYATSSVDIRTRSIQSIGPDNQTGEEKTKPMLIPSTMTQDVIDCDQHTPTQRILQSPVISEAQFPLYTDGDSLTPKTTRIGSR